VIPAATLVKRVRNVGTGKFTVGADVQVQMNHDPVSLSRYQASALPMNRNDNILGRSIGVGLVLETLQVPDKCEIAALEPGDGKGPSTRLRQSTATAAHRLATIQERGECPSRANAA
jgi:hypothetical protein